MTNEEKARKIMETFTEAYGVNIERDSHIYSACMQMAQWKDEQLDSAINKTLERNGDFLKQGKITQYGYDMAFVTIQNIREYLKQ